MQAHRGLRRADRRQPGLLRGLRRRLRVRGAGDRRGARLLPRRRHRPGRQRRHHRRQRRRHLRPPRGRPRRARRRHAPGPARAPAQDAGDGLHGDHCDGRRSCTTTARCSQVVPDGRAARRRLRASPTRSPTKSPTVIRAAKESLNGIDPVDVKRSLPVRAGLHVRAQPLRRRRRSTATRSSTSATPSSASTGASVPDKRMTEDEVVAELRDGMTIGIGGWGSRRKPMSLSARSPAPPLTDLTVVSYGGPDVGLLCRGGQGQAGRLRVRVARLDPARAALPRRPPGRRGRDAASSTRACSCSGSRPRRGGCRSCRPGPGSAPTSFRRQPELRTVQSPYRPDGEGEELVAVPALDLDVALVHLNRADAGGNGQYLGPDPYFDDLFCMAAERRFMSRRAVVADRRPRRQRPGPDAAHQPAHGRRRGRGAERRALHRVLARLRARRGVPAASTPRRAKIDGGVGRRSGPSTSTVGGHDEYRKAVGL